MTRLENPISLFINIYPANIDVRMTNAISFKTFVQTMTQRVPNGIFLGGCAWLAMEDGDHADGPKAR